MAVCWRRPSGATRSSEPIPERRDGRARSVRAAPRPPPAPPYGALGERTAVLGERHVLRQIGLQRENRFWRATGHLSVPKISDITATVRRRVGPGAVIRRESGNPAPARLARDRRAF